MTHTLWTEKSSTDTRKQERPTTSQKQKHLHSLWAKGILGGYLINHWPTCAFFIYKKGHWTGGFEYNDIEVFWHLYSTWTCLFHFQQNDTTHVHAWKTSSNKGSLFRSTNQSVHDAELWTAIFRVFRVRIAAACRADRPHSVRRALRNPPPTNRYCPQQNTTTITAKSSSTQDEGKGRERTRGGRDRKEGWNVASSNLEKDCVFGGGTGKGRRKRV